MTVDDLSWHDGVLLEWTFAPQYRGRPCLELVLALYTEQVKASHRRVFVVRCEEVLRFLLSCDVAELRDYAGAGNVVDGYRRGNVLRLLVTGGFIEAEAKSFRVVRRKSTQA